MCSEHQHFQHEAGSDREERDDSSTQLLVSTVVPIGRGGADLDISLRGECVQPH